MSLTRTAADVVSKYDLVPINSPSASMRAYGFNSISYMIIISSYSSSSA
jgi:hypothetical protein